MTSEAVDDILVGVEETNLLLSVVVRRLDNLRRCHRQDGAISVRRPGNQRGSVLAIGARLAGRDHGSGWAIRVGEMDEIGTAP